MAYELEVWLFADHVGTLSLIHGHLNFRYTAACLENLYKTMKIPHLYAKSLPFCRVLHINGE